MTTANTIRDHIREGYGRIARDHQTNTESCCGGTHAGGCCGPATLEPQRLAEALGYSADQLANLPDDANMGLSCGNPTALASLKPGETVVDLGSGGGFDCFIAGRAVGAGGKVIGVDMTAEMLGKARRNVETYRRHTGLGNVEFRMGEIEHLPVSDSSVDVVISNCVLNLSPDKPQVWREMSRILKPGGRVAVSDLALLRPLPEAVRADVEALIGCVAGAVLVEETREMMIAAGLTDIVLMPKGTYIDAMTDYQDPLYAKITAGLPSGSKASDYITSLNASGRKPRATCCGSSCCT